MRTLWIAATAPLALFLATGCSSAGGDGAIGSSAAAVNGGSIASIALANVGKGACSINSGGSDAFDSSCTGNGGYPEYWCADFARWVWAEAGANTSGLSAAAGSFYVYGQNNGTLHSTPALGDAVVFDYAGGGYADHVAIVTQVNGDGTIETVSGDWGGANGSEATFASTSHVVLNAPAYGSSVGSYPGVMGMTISGFISPAGTGGSPPPGGGSCSEGPGYCTASSQCENGQWVPRASDPAACTSGPGATNSSDACGYGPGYCTATLQCDNGQWVPRSSDPTACSSGPGATGSSNACSYGDGYCTASLQCDSGQWVPRSSDPAACTSGPGATASSNSCSYGDGYCTATMQCDSGQWVPRSSDPTACTSGPGATSSGNACSYGPGYCTATLQCDNGQWVPRSSDPAACTSGPGG